MCHIALLSNSITATERGSFPETLIFANRIRGGTDALREQHPNSNDLVCRGIWERLSQP